MRANPLLIFPLIFCVALFVTVAALASGGLFAEQSIETHGMTVVRIRDTSEKTVCYVVHGPMLRGCAYGSFSTSITCMREK